jgi:hypothetical protein
MRRLDIVWEGKEVGDFDAIADAAGEKDQPLPDFVKQVLRRARRRGK